VELCSDFFDNLLARFDLQFFSDLLTEDAESFESGKNSPFQLGSDARYPFDSDFSFKTCIFESLRYSFPSGLVDFIRDRSPVDFKQTS
jgi:hypothetical protein